MVSRFLRAGKGALVATLLLSSLSALPVPSAFAAPVALTPADRGWLDRIQDRMNTTPSLRGRFEQIAPDGQHISGDVWLSRPGRMRFQYDRPSPLLLVANDDKVVFRDSQLDQTTEIPLERTPLGLLLGSHISLSGDVTVTAFAHQNGRLLVNVVRTALPGEGSLLMAFDDRTLALLGWTVTDAQNRHTQIILSRLQSGEKFPDALFVLPEEK